MLTAADVTACLVTRGDQPEMMDRILDSLIFDQVVVCDNGKRTVARYENGSIVLVRSLDRDWKCAGRYEAARWATRRAVFFQDDDVVVPGETQRRLVDAHMPGVMVANWGHGDEPAGYDDLPLVCGGAVVDRELPLDAIERYAERWTLDDDFAYEADFVVGVLYPEFRHLHLPFEINLEVAQHPSRLVNQPWQRALKLEITNRARRIRDNDPAREYEDWYAGVAA